MAITVEMPKLGNTVEECLLAAWLKHEGDPVVAGEVLAEIETDKASFEVTAPADGVLLRAYCAEGDLVPVYTAICAIGAPDETAPEPGERPRAETPAEPKTPARVEVAAEPERKPAEPGEQDAPAGRIGPAVLSPRARRFAREHGFEPPGVRGTGPGGRVTEADLRELWYTQPRPTAAVLAADGLAPERLAPDGLAPDGLAPGGGSGLGGMIRLTDAGAAISSQPPAGPATEPAVQRPVVEWPAGLRPVAEPPGAPAQQPTVEQLSIVRRRIGSRLRESLTTTAQYTLNGSANAAGLLAARRALKAMPDTAEITIGDLVAYATVRALLRVPDLNAELIDGELHRHTEVHLAFAVDTDRGLMVPVVRDSHRLSLQQLSARMRELTVLTARGVIGPDDLAGGTFTVSNLGGLGIESFTPVLNPPQVAILGVDAITVRPARKADGNIEFIDAIGLSLTLDHQVVDGAPGARFLAVLRSEIEGVWPPCTT
jgi:pyruvate dehydrogenase E2 component (dihydrolipoamide acetyltransferase)